MFPFAQTNLQLYRQLEGLDFPQPEIDRIRRAYEAAVPMFSARYRGSGKPFLAHLVGTASVLAQHYRSATPVLAGLLHAVYAAGDLGFDAGGRQTSRKRKRVRALVGEEAEALISTYDEMSWTPQKIGRYRRSWPDLTAIEQQALALGLANLLDDFLDGGMLTALSKKNRVYLSADLQADVLALADLAAWPDIGERLAAQFDELVRAAPGLATHPGSGFSQLTLPPGARAKLLPRAERAIARVVRVWRRRSSP